MLYSAKRSSLNCCSLDLAGGNRSLRILLFPIGSRSGGTINSICVDLTGKQGRLPDLDSCLLPEDVLVSHVVDGGLLFFLAKKGPPSTSGSLAMYVSSLALIVAAEIDRIVLMQPASRRKVSGCVGDLA